MSHSININKNDEESESDSPPPPDGGWGWMVVFGSFMIHVITDGVTYSFGIFYDEFLKHFKEGKAFTSWILSILVGVTLCSGPLSSSLVNALGCRTVTIAGAILSSICLVMSYYAQNVLTLCLTIGVGVGLGFGLIYLPAIVSVTMYFEKKRSLATGIAVCGSGFGTFIFAPIISKLLLEFGWQTSILIIAAIVLQCAIFGALFRPLENDIDNTKKDKTYTGFQPSELKKDLYSSDQNLHYPILHLNGNKMHRPHSFAHFTPTKGLRHESHGYVATTPKIGYPDINRLALSQPMLTSDNHPEKHHYHGSVRRPFDRPDIFYQGSLMNIPSYRSRSDIKYVGTLERSYHKEDSTDELKICGLIPCSTDTKDTLKQLFNFSLLQDPIFIIFAASNLLTSIGFNIPYVYLVPKAKNCGMDIKTAGMLISIIGAANTIGRIILGYVSDKPWINKLQVYNWSLTICGLATFISAFCNTFSSLAIYSVVFGFTIGAYVGLTSVILVDLLGLEKLTNAFGLLLLFQGIASLVGPPIAGSLYDYMQTYDPGFCLAGVAVCLSGLILFLIPSIQKSQLKKANRVAVQSSAGCEENV